MVATQRRAVGSLRCSACGKLLARCALSGISILQVKCPRCKLVTTVVSQGEDDRASWHVTQHIT